MTEQPENAAQQDNNRCEPEQLEQLKRWLDGCTLLRWGSEDLSDNWGERDLGGEG